MITESSQPGSQTCPDSRQGALRCALFTPKWPATTASNGIVTYVSVLNDQLRQGGHRPVVVTKANGSAVVGAGDEEIAQWSPRYGLLERIGDRLTKLLAQDDSQRRRTQAGRGIAEALTREIGDHPIDLLEMEESFGLSQHVARYVPFPVVVRLHGPWFLNGLANGDRKSVV